MASPFSVMIGWCQYFLEGVASIVYSAQGCNRESMNLLNLSGFFFDIPANSCDGGGAFLKDRAGGGCGLRSLALEKNG